MVCAKFSVTLFCETSIIVLYHLACSSAKLIIFNFVNLDEALRGRINVIHIVAVL